MMKQVNSLILKGRSGFLGLALLCAVQSQVWAAGVDQLKSFSETKLFAEGRFEQTIVNAKGVAKPKQTGRFAFQRPGKFVWKIDKPFPQLIVSNGQVVTTYDEDLEQASQRPLGEALSSSPAALLFGTEKVDTLFSLKNQDKQGTVEWLEATPKSKDSLFERIRVGLQNGIPVEMEILDSMGQKSLLKFTDWKLDKAPSPSQFTFVPPPGVDLIKAK